jgi:hypothetical protein
MFIAQASAIRSCYYANSASRLKMTGSCYCPFTIEAVVAAITSVGVAAAAVFAIVVAVAAVVWL